jgi:hypothetical protein
MICRFTSRRRRRMVGGLARWSQSRRGGGTESDGFGCFKILTSLGNHYSVHLQLIVSGRSNTIPIRIVNIKNVYLLGKTTIQSDCLSCKVRSIGTAKLVGYGRVHQSSVGQFDIPRQRLRRRVKLYIQVKLYLSGSTDEVLDPIIIPNVFHPSNLQRRKHCSTLMTMTIRVK